MKQIEDQLADGLQQLCAQQTRKAKADLDNQRRLLRQLDQLDRDAGQGAPQLYNVQATDLQALPLIAGRSHRVGRRADSDLALKVRACAHAIPHRPGR